MAFQRSSKSFDSVSQEWLGRFLEHRVGDERVLRLVRKWLKAGVLDDGEWSVSAEGTPQGAVISPLLSNIYLHVLDRVWAKHGAQLGELVRYAHDFVVMCHTAQGCEQAQGRIEHVLGRLGLKLHPQKTPRVVLTRGQEGFDFLGCHLHKRMSGRLWQQKGLKRYCLQNWPGRKAMNRVRDRVRELTPPRRCHRDVRSVIAELNPVLRGWGAVLPNGQRSQPLHRRGRLRREEAEKPAAQARWAQLARGPGPTLGSRPLRKPWIASPARDDPLPGPTSWKQEDCVMLRADGPLVSRVREIRMHGLNGGVGSVIDLRA